METLLREFRYSVRTLSKSPGFFVTTVLTLGLGIGACTTIFSVVYAVLLRPLPYQAPNKIVRLWEQNHAGHRINLSDPNFEDFRTENDTLASLAKYSYGPLPVSGGDEPVRMMGAEVSRDFFKVLGVQPLLGRLFGADELRVNGARAALVSYSYWQRHMGGSRDLSKFRLDANNAVYSVIGVMPPEFDFPQGTGLWMSSEVDAPNPSRTAHNWRGLGRIRGGVTFGQARANLSTIAHRIREQYGKNVDLTDAAVVPLPEALVGDLRTALLTLLGAVGLLLLVACANVAGLLLARSSAHRKELAVRAALGAGVGRIVQQFLAESFALSFSGGVLGVLLSAWAVHGLPAILPARLPHEHIAINTSVLLFALVVVLAVAVALGLFAAWRAMSGDVQEGLTTGSQNYTAAGASQQFRGFLVTGEIALTLLILVGAGLLGRSFLRLISTSPGFRQQNLITMEFSFPNQQHQVLAMDAATVARQVHLAEELLTRLRTIPGVQDVGLAGAMPVAAGDNLPEGTFLILNGQAPPTSGEEFTQLAQNVSQTGHALYGVVGAGYFHTLAIPLVRGRLFGDRDDFNSPHVALISEALAQQRWPNQDPIGQVIEFGNMDSDWTPVKVVGVVGDVRARGLNLPPSPIIYVDYRQRGMNANSAPTILLRSTAPAAEVVHVARTAFHDLAPDSPVKFSTFAEEMGGWLADRRFLLLLVGLFGATALALAAVGIYGVVAFSVTRRTQEIGIRMAIGAGRADVLRMIVGEGARLAILGVGIGIAASFGVMRLLSSLLFGISAADPVTFIGVAALLCVVALFASYIPALRAMRLDPNSALRYE
jgi:putative ABC transport system permease protein